MNIKEKLKEEESNYDYLCELNLNDSFGPTTDKLLRVAHFINRGFFVYPTFYMKQSLMYKIKGDKIG